MLRVELGQPKPDGCALLQEPPPLKRHRLPDCSCHTSSAPRVPFTVLHLVKMLITHWLHSPRTGLGAPPPPRRRDRRPVRLKHKHAPYRRPDPPCHKEIKPERAGALKPSQNLPAPGTLRTRCDIDLAGFSVRVVRFRCICIDSLHGLMLALPRHVWCLFLRVDPRHRSTRSDPWSAAASIFPAVSFAIVARFRKRAAYAAATAPSLTSTVTTTP